MGKDKRIGVKRHPVTSAIVQKKRWGGMETRARATRIGGEKGKLSKGYYELVFLSIGKEREGSIKIHILLGHLGGLGD